MSDFPSALGSELIPFFVSQTWHSNATGSAFGKIALIDLTAAIIKRTCTPMLAYLGPVVPSGNTQDSIVSVLTLVFSVSTLEITDSIFAYSCTSLLATSHFGETF